MNATDKPPHTERRRLLTIDFSASEYSEILEYVKARVGARKTEDTVQWARWALLEWVRSADED